ncbi:MAG TPA: flagellar basal body rod C-terminal domain-containing protein, partial [Azospira sp.]|nr:flagellar basal body rod C-terminal domain-containing protein [Azospira sp.]
LDADDDTRDVGIRGLRHQFGDVGTDHQLLAARQSMVSSAQALVTRFQSMESRLDELYQGVGTQITTTVATINSYAQQIGELNQRIVLAQAATQAPANDLLDQRDFLMTELNKLVEVKATTNSDGSYNVFFGTGQQLVVGPNVTELVAQASYADISRIVVGIKTAGSVQELPENLITGGELAGLIRFRSETLDRTSNDVGRLAATMALTMNAQHALGQDLLGQAAGEGSFVADFFTLAAPRTTANSLNTGGAALSASFVTPPPVSATGNFYTNLTNSDYRLAYDGANYTLTRLSDNQTWSNASLATLSTNVAASEGFQLSLAGAMNAGDSFTVMPTKFAARGIAVNASIAADPRLIAAASPVRTNVGATNSGSATVTTGEVGVGYALGALPVTVTYDAGANQLTGFPGGPIAYNPTGTTVTFNGISVDISGTPADNDTFRIERNTGGVSDSRNALALGALQTQGTVAGGTANYQVAYARLVSDAGNKTREIQVTSTAQSALLEQAKSSRESLSGVNLDEEAANLLRYQQAYQASAKAIDIGSRLFDVILAIRG